MNGASGFPRLVPLSFRCTNIFTGNFTNFALNEQGQVYSWGLNSYHQCAADIKTHPNPWIFVPTLIHGLPCISRVAAGLHHTLFLSLSTDGQ